MRAALNPINIDSILSVSGISAINDINFETELPSALKSIKSIMFGEKLSRNDKAMLRLRVRETLLGQCLDEGYIDTMIAHELGIDGITMRVIAEGDRVEPEWLDPKALPAETDPVPTMPPELVPKPLRSWLVDVADRASIPLECATISATVVLGSLVGRNLGIRPERNDSWTVVPNLWGLDIARPGDLKSHRSKKGLEPLKPLISRARAEYESKTKEARVRRCVLEANLSKAKKKKGEISEEEIRDLFNQIDECKVPEKRYYTNDSTPEKIGVILSENPRGVLVYCDEVMRLLKGFNRQGREGEREFYLEAWNGTGSYTVDRISRGTLHIPGLCLSVLGTAQPGKIRRHINEAINGCTGDDGLLQRFQLLVWPDSLGEWKRVEKHVNEEAEIEAYRVFERIDNLDVGALGAFEADIPYVRFDDQAQAIFNEWRDELEKRLRGESRYPGFESHLSKYRSLMPSLALLFELIDWTFVSSVSPSFKVSEKSARLAAAWCEFLEHHARKLYSVEINRSKLSIRALAAKIKAGAIQDTTTLREVYRSQWEYLRTPEDVFEGLSELEKLNWIRIVTEESTGGRRKKIIRIHPSLREEN